MGDIDVFATPEDIILSKGDNTLWCNRKNGELIPKSGYEIKAGSNVVKLDASCKCFVGKLNLLSETDWRLLLVSKATLIGRLPLHGDKVYCVDKVILLPLSQAPLPEELKLQEGNEQMERAQTSQKEPNYKEKLERRLTDAILRMFNDSKSFYYSFTGDLTRSLQQQSIDAEDGEKNALPLWKKVDERFFWNYQMLKELTGMNNKDSASDPWIVPIIQGYYETMTILLSSTMNTGFFVRHSSADQTMPPAEESNLAVFENVESTGDILQEDKTAEESTVSELMPDALGVKEGDVSKEGNLDDHSSEIKAPSKLEDSNLQHTETTSHPSVLEAGTPAVDDSVVETMPVSSDNTGVAKESQVLSDNPHPDVIEMPSVSSSNPEDHAVKEPLTAVKGIDPVDESVEDEQLPFSPGSPPFSGDSLTSITYEKPEDNEDDPDGIASILGLKKLGKREEMIQMQDLADSDDHCVVTLISRRSRYRAGTRYRRRGIDSTGAVANFVETEQIMEIKGQVASYLIVRGSVPVYWSQPGYKYRPPPVIERGHFETSVAFRRHFDDQFQHYKEQAIINLNNQHGREQILGDVYSKHAVEMNNPKLTYVAFDYHSHCKGRQVENTKLLMDKIQDITKKFKFTWITRVDSKVEVLCHQQGVFRVNCMDCLDRTNVIQSTICKEMLVAMLHKMMVYDPEQQCLSGAALQQFQELWANHGDAISRQYTGTDALKGDLTRYGERKIKGYVKDGYNSAHRYYRNLFTDTYRQIVIDLQQGVSVNEAHKAVRSEGEMNELEGWGEEYNDRESEIDAAKDNCKATLYPNMEKSHILVWPMLEPQGYSFLESVASEQVLFLMFNKERETVHFANYDLNNKQVCCFIQLVLSRIKRIEIGQLGTRRHSSKRHHIRIHYTLSDDIPTVYYFTLLPLLYTSAEEDRAILESIAISFKIQNQDIVVDNDNRLQRKKSPLHQGVVHLVMPQHLIEGYDSDISNTSLEDQELEPVVDPEQDVSSHPEDSISSQVQIRLTTPTESEYNLLSVSLTSQSAPTSPILKKRYIPTVTLTNSSEGEESAIEPANMTRQRSHSVEMLPDVHYEDEKLTNSDNPTQTIRSRAFSRITGIRSRFKFKSKDSVTPIVPQESEASSKPSTISNLKRTAVKTVTSLKEKTQMKIKTKSKTTVISI